MTTTLYGCREPSEPEPKGEWTSSKLWESEPEFPDVRTLPARLAGITRSLEECSKAIVQALEGLGSQPPKRSMDVASYRLRIHDALDDESRARLIDELLDEVYMQGYQDGRASMFRKDAIPEVHITIGELGSDLRDDPVPPNVLPPFDPKGG